MSESDASDLTPDPDAALVEALQSESTPETNDDEAEIELGADKLKVPKKVKEAWDGIQATTQKEREAIRSEREAVAKERGAHAEQARLVAAFDGDRTTINTIDKQLEPYLKLTPADWAAWGAQDQDAALNAQSQINALQIERQKVFNGMQVKYNDMTTRQKAAEDERKANSERDLSVKIKDWSPAKKAALVKTAEAVGFQASEVEPFMADWRIAAVFDELAQFRALKARAAIPKPPAPGEIQMPETTTTKIKSNTGGKVDWKSDRASAKTFEAGFLAERAARQRRD